MPRKKWLVVYGTYMCMCIALPRGAVCNIYLLTQAMPMRGLYDHRPPDSEHELVPVGWFLPGLSPTLTPSPRDPWCKTHRQIGKEFSNWGEGPHHKQPDDSLQAVLTGDCGMGPLTDGVPPAAHAPPSQSDLLHLRGALPLPQACSWLLAPLALSLSGLCSCLAGSLCALYVCWVVVLQRDKLSPRVEGCVDYA